MRIFKKLLAYFLKIATSVAARGLDVKHLILVVNYDCPNHHENYIHRCGRTKLAKLNWLNWQSRE
jgi:superfamily II DNA/RNA helicase